MELFINTFWLFLPAAFANMAPVIFKRVPLFAAPVDFGFYLSSQRIFGANKTWRGLIFGTLTAVIVAHLQGKAFLWGLTLGAGALAGDLFKSFLKRRLNIPPGRSWPVFDQTDWRFGAYFLSGLAAPLEGKVLLAALVIFGPLHALVNIAGYSLGVRRDKF